MNMRCDAIAEVETDKATIPFEVQEKGYMAKINLSTDAVPVGSPVAVLAKKEGEVKEFNSFSFEGGEAPAPASEAPPPAAK